MAFTNLWTSPSPQESGTSAHNIDEQETKRKRAVTFCLGKRDFVVWEQPHRKTL